MNFRNRTTRRYPGCWLLDCFSVGGVVLFWHLRREKLKSECRAWQMSENNNNNKIIQIQKTTTTSHFLWSCGFRRETFATWLPICSSTRWRDPRSSWRQLIRSRLFIFPFNGTSTTTYDNCNEKQNANGRLQIKWFLILWSSTDSLNSSCMNTWRLHISSLAFATTAFLTPFEKINKTK